MNANVHELPDRSCSKFKTSVCSSSNSSDIPRNVIGASSAPCVNSTTNDELVPNTCSDIDPLCLPEDIEDSSCERVGERQRNENIEQFAQQKAEFSHTKSITKNFTKSKLQSSTNTAKRCRLDLSSTGNDFQILDDTSSFDLRERSDLLISSSSVKKINEKEAPSTNSFSSLDQSSYCNLLSEIEVKPHEFQICNDNYDAASASVSHSHSFPNSENRHCSSSEQLTNIINQTVNSIIQSELEGKKATIEYSGSSLDLTSGKECDNESNKNDFNYSFSGSECAYSSEDHSLDSSLAETTVKSFIKMEWLDGCPVPPRCFHFDDSHSGIKLDSGISRATREVEYFLFFFDEKLVGEIADQTNMYYRKLTLKDDFQYTSRNKNWVDVSVTELYIMFALTMLMPYIEKPQTTDYWKNDPLLPTPIFNQNMSRDRYLIIKNYIYFGLRNKEPDIAPLDSMGLVFEYINDKMAQAFTPFQNLVITDSKFCFRKLIKRNEINIEKNCLPKNLYLLSDCRTGIVLNMCPYFKAPSGVVQKSAARVMNSIAKKMSANYLGKGHILYSSGLSPNFQLCRYLLEKNTGYCGKTPSRRKGMPIFSNQLAFEFKQKDDMLVIKSNQNCNTYILTTVHDASLTETNDSNKVSVKKTVAEIDFENNVQIVQINSPMAKFQDRTKSNNSWHKKFLGHLLDITLMNAYNLHKFNTNSTLSFDEFIYNVSEQLINDYKKPRRAVIECVDLEGSDVRLESKGCIARHHLITAPLNGKGKPVIGRCQSCSGGNRTSNGKKRRVTTWCSTCHVPLCTIPCFMVYHTKENLNDAASNSSD